MTAQLAPCEHTEYEEHPAEPDVGISYRYAQCLACDATTDHFEEESDWDQDPDGTVYGWSAMLPVWPDLDDEEEGNET